MVDFTNPKYNYKERVDNLCRRMSEAEAEAVVREVITTKEQEYWGLKTEWCRERGVNEKTVFAKKDDREAWIQFLKNRQLSKAKP